VNPKARFEVIQKSSPEKARDERPVSFDEYAREQGKKEAELQKPELPPALRKFKEEQDRQAKELRKAFEEILARREDLQKYQFVTKERQKKDEEKRRVGQRLS